MTKEELLNSIEQIGTSEDENERRTLLTGLREDLDKVFNEVDTLKQENQNYVDTIATKDKQIEDAQKYNKQMFLQLSAEREESNLEIETGIKKEEEPTYKSYSDLAKGFLK